MMIAADLLEASLIYIKLLTPFIFVFAVIAYAEELIQLLRKSVFFKRNKDTW